MTVSERRECGHLADQPPRLLAARFGVEDFFRIGIKSRERGNRRNHHAHRVGVIVKAIEKLLDALVDERVVGDVVGPVLELLSVGNSPWRIRYAVSR